MRKTIYAFVTLLLVSAIFSCGLVSGKGDAQEVAEALLNERIENGGFGSNTYYSEYFWEAVEPGKWENIKKIVPGLVSSVHHITLHQKTMVVLLRGSIGISISN